MNSSILLKQLYFLVERDKGFWISNEFKRIQFGGVFFCFEGKLHPIIQKMRKKNSTLLFLLLFKLFKKIHDIKKHKIVVASHPILAIALLFLKKCTRSKFDMVMLQLILPDHQGFFAKKFWEYVCNEMKLIIVNSYYEIDNLSKRFDLPEGRVVFLHNPVDFFDKKTLFDVNHTAQNHIMTGGGAGRDFELFIKAMEQEQYDSYLLTFDKSFLPEGIFIPKNLKIVFAHELKKQFGNAVVPFQKYLVNAQMIVVPLLNMGKSIGQTTIAQAMFSGSPLIVADIPVVHDYLKNGEHGLYYKSGDMESLLSAIDTYKKNPEYAQKMAKNAYDFAINHFTYEAYAEKLIFLVDKTSYENTNNQQTI